MKSIFIYFTILFFCLAGTGCKKYLDINQNPNAAEEPPINGLLAQVTYATGTNVFNVSNYTSYYTQYLSSPNPSSDVDIYNNVDASSTWTGLYDVMTDLYDMRRFSLEKNLIAYTGVSDVLMALNLNMATNLWGDVPYSEAFQGATNLTPKFDNQKDLYDTCLALVARGISELSQPDAANQLDKASDFIHGGNSSAWLKTAYALRARLYTLVSKRSAYNPDKVLSALASAYKSNNDDAQINIFQVRNPWAQVALNNSKLDLDGWLSSYFVNATNGTTYGVKDPRLPLIATLTRFNDYRGTPNGKGRTGSGTNREESYLGYGSWYSADNSPLIIISFAECKFMEAEAYFRKGDKASAYTAYQAGIYANMQKLGVPTADAQAYVNSPAVSVGANNLTLQLIMKEKYVATFLNPVTWDDMRRNDYKYAGFTLPVNASLNTFIRRMNYPTNEISTNGKNVPAVQLTDELWWD